MASSKGARSLLLVLMDAIFVLAVVDVARLVVLFFGSLAESAVGTVFTDVTAYLVFPLGIDPVSTPWSGVFDWDTAVTVGILLAIEGVLGMARRRM
jgi:ACR3 family arsenite efflux pump ArsB